MSTFFCFLLASFEAGGNRPQPQGLRTSVSREAHRLGVKTGGVPSGFKRRKRFWMFLSNPTTNLPQRKFTNNNQ